MDPKALRVRRENTFLVLAGIFLGAMAMLNIVGITRFVQIGPLTLAAGVLAYPLTFLCTDLISELYGKKRASALVWVGLLVNFFVIGVLAITDLLPSVADSSQPPWQKLNLSKEVFLPNGTSVKESVELFTLIYQCTAGAVFASMMAYIAAQFCDVFVFHAIKKRTKGKHFWLRNNGSTLVSTLVDSTMVITVTFGASVMRGEMAIGTALTILVSNYLFKFFAALFDTIPAYLLRHHLRRFLALGEEEEVGY